MQELIKVTVKDGIKTVSARELHKSLEVGSAFKDWMPRMLQYGFEEKRDFTLLFFEHPQNKQPTADYILTIDTAKEICMLQRTEKGKQIRHYFIEVEKAATMQLSNLSRLEILQLAMEAERENIQLKEQAAAAAPKLEYHDKVLATKNGFPISHIASELEMSAIELNKQLNLKGVQHKVGRTWILNAKHQNKGYTQVVTHTFQDSEGNNKTSHLTVWTEEGRKFIHSFFK